MRCIFCEFENFKDNIIYEGNHSYLLMDKFPASLGHMLIIPKKHYQSIDEIPDNVLLEIMKLKVMAIDVLEKKLNVSAYNIVLANGKSARQSIMHAHYHMIPRSIDDKIVISLNEHDSQENYETMFNTFRKMID